MKEGIEHSEQVLRRINLLQIQLAGLIFPECSEEQALERWTNEGYSEAFRNIIEGNEHIYKRVTEGDLRVAQEIYTILTKTEKHEA